MFLAPVVLAVLVIHAVGAEREQRRRFVQLAVVFAIGHAVVVGGWMARNWVELGHPIITQRGGHVLAHRVELNTMTAAEYGVAFLW